MGGTREKVLSSEFWVMSSELEEDKKGWKREEGLSSELLCSDFRLTY